MIHATYGVRVTHRATGLQAYGRASSVTGTRRSRPTMADLLQVALRLLRARLWQQRHRFGPQPIVRTYDLIDGDRSALIELLDGNLPGDR